MQNETVRRLKLVLNHEEYAALEELSERNLRLPAAEARMIVRERLRQLGLIRPETDVHRDKSSGAALDKEDDRDQ